MRKRYSGFLILSFFLLYGCSEDSSTAPEEDGNYKLETTETIGTAGGTIEIDDFSLSVPAGAFESDQTIEVYASSDDQPFGNDQVTRSFLLEGLPDEYSQPISVGVKYEGILSGEFYIAMGHRVYDYDMDDTTTVYYPLTAADSSGFLVADIPASQDEVPCIQSGVHVPHEPLSDVVESIEILGYDGYGSDETDHFEIFYPQDLITVSIPSIGLMLEDIYSVLSDTLTLPWLSDSKMIAIIHRLDPGIAAIFYERESTFLALSKSDLGNGHFTPVRLQAGDKLLYKILNRLDQNILHSTQIRLQRAVRTWAEEKFTDDENFQYPSKFIGNEMAPLHGFQAVSQTYADGLSSVIKFLYHDPRFGKAGIDETYTTIWGGNHNATSALLNAVDALVTEWWPGFFKSYVGGEIYGVGKDVFLASANLSGTWTIDDGNDADSTFTLDYPDLSAKLFKINLEYDSIDPIASLALDLTSEITTPISVMLFGVEGNELIYWGHSTAQGSTSLLVTDVRDLYDAGWRELLVVVVNCNVSDTYLEQSEIDLRIEMSSEIEPVGLDFTECEISLLHFRGYYWRDYFNPSEEDYQYFDSWIDYYSETAEGSFSGGMFTGGFDFMDQWDNRYSGTVNARVVGDPPNSLVSIDFHQIEENSYRTRKTRIVAENMELTSGGGSQTWMSFEVYGTNASDYVRTFSDTLIYNDAQDTLLSWDSQHAEQIPSIAIDFR